jgi:hypothetical protein
MLVIVCALASPAMRADDKTAPIMTPEERAAAATARPAQTQKRLDRSGVPVSEPERRAWWLRHTGDFGRARGQLQPQQPKARGRDETKQKVIEQERKETK